MLTWKTCNPGTCFLLQDRRCLLIILTIAKKCSGICSNACSVCCRSTERSSPSGTPCQHHVTVMRSVPLGAILQDPWSWLDIGEEVNSLRTEVEQWEHNVLQDPRACSRMPPSSWWPAIMIMMASYQGAYNVLRASRPQICLFRVPCGIMLTVMMDSEACETAIITQPWWLALMCYLTD